MNELTCVPEDKRIVYLMRRGEPIDEPYFEIVMEILGHHDEVLNTLVFKTSSTLEELINFLNKNGIMLGQIPTVIHDIIEVRTFPNYETKDYHLLSRA